MSEEAAPWGRGEHEEFAKRVLDSLTRIEVSVRRLESRLREVEHEQVRLKTWATCAGMTAGAVGSYILKLIGLPPNPH